MRPAIFSILMLTTTVSFGQFAIVSNKDGYANIRSSAEIGKNIVDTLRNGHFVYCFEARGNWINIDYSRKKHALNGYIYRTGIELISDYETLPLIAKLPNASTFGKDSIRITVTERKFDKATHRFSYYKDAKDQIELINGKQYWGTDGGQPKTEYKSILVQLGRKKIYLTHAALDNLFEPNINNTRVKYDSKNDILYIQSMNSDGAGSYEVIWRIKHGIYKDRYIAYGF